MNLGVPKESAAGETRVAATPVSVTKLVKLGIVVHIEHGAGDQAGFSDANYSAAGARLVDSQAVWQQEIICKVAPPNAGEIQAMKADALLIGLLEPLKPKVCLQALATAKINAIAMELIPRSSRAQSMDALSSQANIAGYRAVIEAATHYGHFLPMMMTAAGMAKPARVIVLGAGVAGLQAIATAKRLGAQVEAFDVRPEVRDEVISLGAKFIEIDLGEEGSGQGGYAKALTAEAQKKQQEVLADRLKKADIVISTASIPGKPAPILITPEALSGMRTGSVIIDMAAASGGNCPLTKVNEVITVNGVKLIGHSNYPAMVAADASLFYAQNLLNLLSLLATGGSAGKINLNLNDDIIAASLVALNGELRRK